MNVHVYSGQMEKAVNVYKDLAKAQVVPDIRVFNILLNGYVKEKNLSKIEETREAIRVLELNPDSYTYSILISAFVMIRKLDLALEVFEQYKNDKGVEQLMNIYYMIVKGLGQEGRTEEALAVLNILEEKKIIPTRDIYVHVLRSAIKTSSHLIALKCYSDMKKYHIQLDLFCWNSLIECLCKSSCVEKALVIFEKMKRSPVLPDQRSYHLMIMMLVENKRVDDAEKLFRELQESGTEIDKWTWRLVIQGMISTQKMQKALELADEMISSGCEVPQTLKNLLYGECLRNNQQKWFTSRFDLHQPFKKDSTDSFDLELGRDEKIIDVVDNLTDNQRQVHSYREKKEKEFLERFLAVDQQWTSLAVSSSDREEPEPFERTPKFERSNKFHLKRKSFDDRKEHKFQDKKPSERKPFEKIQGATTSMKYDQPSENGGRFEKRQGRAKIAVKYNQSSENRGGKDTTDAKQKEGKGKFQATNDNKRTGGLLGGSEQRTSETHVRKPEGKNKFHKKETKAEKKPSKSRSVGGKVGSERGSFTKPQSAQTKMGNKLLQE
eukprot:TRINITY_DN9764_c0_g1_i2.p1 TRINITY_DN9764_c0_g1~~TRINITY_DN9764_c0_g1_i2.p1  ORF type:complete len:576 (+),score=127.31 TRINITY_DN9764_c0_g1_i2:77-1729(+)